jgi:hypothetical protein
MPPNKKTVKQITQFDEDLGEITEEIYTSAEEGYKKGLIVGGQQLKPLGIEASMGVKTKIETLKKIRAANEKYIDGWGENINKMVYDIVWDGIESGKSLNTIMDDIIKATDKSILQAKKETSDIVIDAARKGEIDLYRQAGIGLFRDIAIVDDKTCGVCLGLNDQIFEVEWDENDGYVSYDNGQFLQDIVAQLKESSGYDTWDDLNPYECRFGPQYHSNCRCHFAPVLTFEQYKGVVQTTISEV